MPTINFCIFMYWIYQKLN